MLPAEIRCGSGSKGEIDVADGTVYCQCGPSRGETTVNVQNLVRAFVLLAFVGAAVAAGQYLGTLISTLS